MKISKFKISILCIMVCLSAFFLTLLAVTAAADKNTASVAADISLSTPIAGSSEEYTLKISGNCAAVFSGSDTKPLFITDIQVDTLREADRDLLEHGITVRSKTELLRLIEDFNS